MLKESRKNEKFEELMEAALNYVSVRGFKEIKSTMEGYERPFQYTMQNKDVTFTPDITAKSRDKKHYFEVAQRSDDPTFIVSKWKLLSMLAKMQNGSFTILVPYGQNKFAEQLVMEHEIEATLVKLEL
jgi:hypothetical protein